MNAARLNLVFHVFVWILTVNHSAVTDTVKAMGIITVPTNYDNTRGTKDANTVVYVDAILGQGQGCVGRGDEQHHEKQ